MEKSNQPAEVEKRHTTLEVHSLRQKIVFEYVQRSQNNQKKEEVNNG